MATSRARLAQPGTSTTPCSPRRRLPGSLTLQMLKELTGKRIRELFQVIAGTSTGGILALAIQEGAPEFIGGSPPPRSGFGEGEGEVEGEGEGGVG